MNALGARVDALIQNNHDLHLDLEHDLGRQRDIASPTAIRSRWRSRSATSPSIPRNPNWGFDIQRRIRRTGERIRWTNDHGRAPTTPTSRAPARSPASRASTQGLGLDVQVFGKFVYRREWKTS